MRIKHNLLGAILVSLGLAAASGLVSGCSDRSGAADRMRPMSAEEHGKMPNK